MWILISAVIASVALAQDDGDETRDVTLRCVRSASIDRIRAIDDSTLAVFLRNRRVYLNALPRQCPGLARYGRIAYETSGGRLCSKDRIAVVYDTAGEAAGLPCPLGEFHRADTEAVELLIAAAQNRGSTSAVTAEPVELPPAEDDAQE